jgi:hypothetical protein
LASSGAASAIRLFRVTQRLAIHRRPNSQNTIWHRGLTQPTVTMMIMAAKSDREKNSHVVGATVDR